MRLDTKYDFELIFYISVEKSAAFLVELVIAGLPPAKGKAQSPIHIANKHLDRARLLLEALARTIPDNFEPLRCAIALELTLYSPVRCPPGDALNFLGGVGDVLQRKSHPVARHLGPLADIALYHDDRQIRRVRFDQRVAAQLSYVVRVRAIGREPLGVDWLPRRRNPKVSEGRRVSEGAALCVAFANSNDAELGDYNLFIAWCLAMGVVTENGAATLSSRAAATPATTAELMAQIRQFRQAIRSLLASAHADADVLSTVTQLRRRCGAHESVKLVGSSIAIRCDVREDDPSLPLCAIWRSAAGLLGSGLPARVRRCADKMCGKLFIDLSRNRSRRWCDMSSCGSKNKVRRFRERQRHRRATTAKTSR